MAVALIHPLQAASSYQPRSELDAIEAWWCDGRPGVCALVGLGGAGKTALAERFLAGIVEGRLPDPAGVFVYSFYEQPIAEEFFAALGSWIGSGASHFEVLDALKHGARRLLILDGLERAQRDDGEIDDTPLRDLMTRAASGLLGSTSVLTTTRFPITPIESMPAFHRIDIQSLTLEAAIELLRRRKVLGTDEELARIAESCKRHALLIDLTAGCIAELGGSVPELDEVDRLRLAEVKPELRSVLELQRHFLRTARQYREYLEKREPEAWAVLRLACLFKNGVRLETLKMLRTMEVAEVRLALLVDESIEDLDLEEALHDPEEERVLPRLRKHLTPSGAPKRRRAYLVRYDDLGQLKLAPTDPSEDELVTWIEEARLEPPFAWMFRDLDRDQWIGVQLRAALQQVRDTFADLARTRALEPLGLLSRLSLIDARSSRVLVHPAVREGLLDDQPADELSHLRVLSVLTIANLAGRPAAGHAKPQDWEELMHQTIAAGQPRLAWSFYHQRVGGFVELGVKQSAYARGEALMRTLAGAKLEPLEEAAFRNEWGLYLHRLGRLQPASECFRSAAEAAARLGRPWLATTALQNLAETEVLAGHLVDARSTLLAAADLLARSGDPPAKMRAEESFARESRMELLPQLAHAGARTQRFELDPMPLESLLSKGAWSEAERFCRFALIGARAYHRTEESVHHAYLSLHLAETAREKGDRARALGHVKLAREWALRHGERELLARTYVESARLQPEHPDWIAEGVRIATDAGYATMLVDLALVRAELALMRHRRAEALAEIEDAIEAAASQGYSRGAAKARALRDQPKRIPVAARNAIVVSYRYRDSHRLEELLRLLESCGLADRIGLWHDAIEEPEPPHTIPLDVDPELTAKRIASLLEAN